MTSCSGRFYLREKKPHWPVVNMLCESQTAVDTEGKEIKHSHGNWTPTVQSISNQIKSNLPCFSSVLTVNASTHPLYFLQMSFLYLTLFILYIKGSIILHNKAFLLTELSFTPPLSLHTFFTWFSNLNVVLYKNLLNIFQFYNLDTTTQLGTAKTFTCTNTLVISSHLFFLFTRTMKMEQCSETSAHFSEVFHPRCV